MKNRFCCFDRLVCDHCLNGVRPCCASDPILIGISKIVAHPALDAIEKGIQEVVTFPVSRCTLRPSECQR
jgi:ABC-type uncharacterized transport system substrate-binding protein